MMHRMIRTLAVALLVSACRSKSPPPEKTVSARPEPAPAPAPPARLIAIGAAGAAGGHGLTFVRVDATGVHTIGTAEQAGNVFGWLDDHTLIAVEDQPAGGGVTVRRFVDGKPTDPIAIGEAAWPKPMFVGLYLVDRDQIWLSKCVSKPTDSPGECSGEAFLRVSPGAPQAADALPAGVDPTRAIHPPLSAPYPLPPDATAPTGVTLAIANGVAECHAGADSSRFPDGADSEGFTFTPTATRWVSTAPPIYELAYDETNPADFKSPQRAYYLPCQAKPLAGYAWLGGDRWASYDDGNGAWVFHAGAKELGTVPGTALLR